jgi:hypothetical protein
MPDYFNPPHQVAAPESAPVPEPTPSGEGKVEPETLNEVLDPLEKLPGEPAKETKEAKPEVKEDLFEVKVNGKVKHLTRDQMIVAAQKAEAANEKFSEVSKKEARIEAFMEEMANNPEEALSKIGIDVDSLAEKRLAEKVKKSQQTPEQTKQSELEAKLAAYEAKEKAALDAKTKEENRVKDEANTSKITNGLQEAAKRHNIKSWAGLEDMATIALEAISQGYEPTPDQIAQEVLRRQEEHLAEKDSKVYSKLDGADLLDYLGKATVDKVLKASLAAKGIKAPVSKAKAPPPPVEKPEKGFVTEKELMASLKKKGLL